MNNHMTVLRYCLYIQLNTSNYPIIFIYTSDYPIIIIQKYRLDILT